MLIVPSFSMICVAQARSPSVFDGWQLKTIFRLGVSVRPVTWNGPPTVKSFTRGGVVVPALALPDEAVD